VADLNDCRIYHDSDRVACSGDAHVNYDTTISRSFYAEQRLERALRPGDLEFEQARDQILIEHLVGKEKVHPFNSLDAEVTATVRNGTERTISGLEIRGAIVDSQNSVVRERTVVVIPAQRTALEQDEAINVRILLESINKDSERAHPVLEVTGVRFD
jgi:hypothetical protein